jgi:hypothetical protein
MKRPYREFLAFVGFEPCKDTRGVIIKKVDKVFVAYKAVNFAVIYTAKPIGVEIL